MCFNSVVSHRLSTAWGSAFFAGNQFFAGLVSSRAVLCAIDYGSCATTGKSLTSFAFHALGLGCITDYLLSHKVAKTGVNISETRYVNCLFMFVCAVCSNNVFLLILYSHFYLPDLHMINLNVGIPIVSMVAELPVISILFPRLVKF